MYFNTFVRRSGLSINSFKTKSPLYIAIIYIAIKTVYDINSIIFFFFDFEVRSAIKYPNKLARIVGIMLENSVNKVIIITILGVSAIFII